MAFLSVQGSRVEALVLGYHAGNRWYPAVSLFSPKIYIKNNIFL